MLHGLRMGRTREMLSRITKRISIHSIYLIGFRIFKCFGGRCGSRYVEGVPQCFLEISKIQKTDLPKIQSFHADPKLFKHIQSFFKNMSWLSGIYLCFKIIHNCSRLTKGPPSFFFPFLFNTLRDTNRFWTHNHLQIAIWNILFKHRMSGSYQCFDKKQMAVWNVEISQNNIC